MKRLGLLAMLSTSTAALAAPDTGPSHLDAVAVEVETTRESKDPTADINPWIARLLEFRVAIYDLWSVATGDDGPR